MIKPYLEPHITEPKTLEKITIDAALAILEIIEKNLIVDWINNPEIKKDIMNAIDDYLYDVICHEHQINLTPDEMDRIIEEYLRLASRRDLNFRT